MGWARTLLLGDIGNRLDIADTERDIGHMRSLLRASRERHDSLEQRIEALEQENEQVELFVVLLLNALRRKDILSEDEVQHMVSVVEA